MGAGGRRVGESSEWLLRDDRGTLRTPLPKTRRREQDGDSRRVRCPICGWSPDLSSRWQCGRVGWPEFFAEGCGHSWNTFETDGVCPGCGHVWQWTACLACHRWSRRADWYEKATGS